jgi:hypothetical protein
VRENNIKRVMERSAAIFNHAVTAQQYIELYEKMLQRPLIDFTGRIASLKDPNKCHKTVLAPFENLTISRQYEIIRGNLQRIGSALDRLKNPRRKDVLKGWLEKKKVLKPQHNAGTHSPD